MTEKLLTLEEAAAMLRRKPRFARRLVSERQIRFVYVGRTPYIPASAIDEYIDAHTIQPVVVRWRGGKAA